MALVGHRGTGKTSLCEALLYQSGALTRLGTIADGTTVSDHDEDEKRRSMSISASLVHLEHRDHRINLIDTPGDPSFIADAVEALRVVEGALVVVSGVLGVEVMTARMWNRADALGIPRVVVVEHARSRAGRFRNGHGRAAGAALGQVRRDLDPDRSRLELPGRDRRAAHVRLRRSGTRGRPGPDPGRHSPPRRRPGATS